MYAVIDIGTNSVRLLLAEYRNGRVERLSKEIAVTRLGEGIAQDPVLRPTAMERTVAAIAGFKVKAEASGAHLIGVFGTSALRGAPNREDFIALTKKECGCHVEVISGAEEATLGFVGAFGMTGGGALLDVGGGSTELSVGQSGVLSAAVSVPIGAVRLRDIGIGPGRIGKAARQHMLDVIDGMIAGFDGIVTEGGVLTGIGGTATTLASVDLEMKNYDPERIEGYELPLEKVARITDRLSGMTLTQKKQLPGLMPQRADIIAGGMWIVRRVMERKGFESLRVSESDNLEGYLLRKIF